MLSYFTCMIICLYAGTYITYVSCALRDQKRAFDTLKQEL